MMVEPSPRTKAVFVAPDLCDAYALEVAEILTPETAARLIFERTPRWVNGLMAVRNLAVKPFGLIGSEQHLPVGKRRFGMFPVLDGGSNFMTLGLDDKHLDFRIVLETTPAGKTGTGTCVTLGTSVRCHNALGRAYLTVIRPFHRRIAKAMLRQLALTPLA